MPVERLIYGIVMTYFINDIEIRFRFGGVPK
jgi:hypothetical protein